MTRLILKSTAIAFTGLLSLSASALPLNEYNLIVADDFVHQSSSIGGRVFVGGNLIAHNAADLGVTLNKAPSIDSLVTVGNIEGNNNWFNVQAGNVVTGGSVNSANFNFNGGGSLISGNQSALHSQRDDILSQLNTASTRFRGMEANGQVSVATNKTSFDYTGTGTTAVFNVNASDVFAQNASLKLNAGTADTVVINVSTAHLANGAGQVAYDFTAPGGINFTEGFAANGDGNNLGASNILWNFYDATKLSLQGMDTFRGSLLAMGADIMSIGTADGSIAAKSLIQQRQIHDYAFVPPSEVPLPASVQFLLMGLFTLMGVRRWRKSKVAKA